MSSEYSAGLRKLLKNIGTFSEGIWPGQALRPYQVTPAVAIVEAVMRSMRGELGTSASPNSFAVVFSRQAGKDEMTAQLLAYLLNLFQLRGGQIVVAAPTVRQAAISKARLVK